MFWTKNQAENKIEWRKNPGCFERHLQRRFNNPLFPKNRRIVSADELKIAREKDDKDRKEFLKAYDELFSKIDPQIQDLAIMPNFSTKIVQEIQDLLEKDYSVNGNIQEEVEKLEKTEEEIISHLTSLFPSGAEQLKIISALSHIKRMSFLTQMTRSDSPILKDEQAPSLLSEDMETIKAMGLISRKLPGLHPNEREIIECLEKAKNEGLKTDYTQKAINAWHEAKE